MTSFTKDLRLLGLDLSLTYRTTSGTFEDGDLALTESTARATPGRRVDLAVANGRLQMEINWRNRVW